MRDITWQEFGGWLQQVRKRQGLSQERLAEMMGYTRIHIWRLEHNERRPGRKFLLWLPRTITLTPMDRRQLITFAQMAEYHCDDFEADNDEAGASRAGLRAGTSPYREATLLAGTQPGTAALSAAL